VTVGFLRINLLRGVILLTIGLPIHKDIINAWEFVEGVSDHLLLVGGIKQAKTVGVAVVKQDELLVKGSK
jgi:hypothetical protein